MQTSSLSRIAVLRPVALVVLSSIALLSTVNAQTTSGQISGVVLDSQGGSVPGASVQVMNTLTKQMREFKTEANGSFLFPNLVPGNYDAKVMQPGFKTYEQTGINVSAQEHVDLHTLRLELGEVSSSIEVAAEASHVATDSSDRSIAINTRQIEDIPTAGRQFTDVLRGLPGTQVTATVATKGWANSTPAINGGQAGTTVITLDGVISQDSGTFGLTGYLTPSVDAIGEVKVLVSNYSAEYGARAGGQINFTFKSGTNSYHGSLYNYWRHESLNANTFFNNKNGVVRGRYRYMNPGGTFGGPLVIPGTNFNRSRNKLFFFFSYDYLHNVTVGNVNSYTMPTALERAGDFSKTVTSQGVLIPIKDPTNNGAQFPSNIVPAPRISPIGAAFLNFFPLPNTTDPSGLRGFNTQFQNAIDNPREDKILRVDYAVGQKTTAYVRLIQDYYGSVGYGASQSGPGGGWRQMKNGYGIPAVGSVLNVIHTFAPNLVSEVNFGLNRSHQFTYPDDPNYSKLQLPLHGLDGSVLPLPNFFNANGLRILPNINFGTNSAQSAGQSVTAAPSFGWDSRWPFEGTDTEYNGSVNLTWVKGSHNMKTGFFIEFNARGTPDFSTYNVAGTYYVGTDTANPFDTGYPYSNLLAGSVQAYGEDNWRGVNTGRYHHVEWFVQDAWKVNRRLSLDYGMRFQIISPYLNAGQKSAVFSSAAYSKAQQGQLLYPAVVNGQKVALNPVTGATYLFARAASFDPASYPSGGSPFTGMQIYQAGEAFFHTPPVLYAPRLGFSWDVFGNGKTAVRGGIGIFYQQAMAIDTTGGLATAPPLFQAPLFFNTTFTNLLSAQGFLTPQNVNGGSRDYKNPTTYQWSFGIQRDLGKGIILDVAYVGNVLHHGMGVGAAGPPQVDINAVTPLTTWSPATGVNKTLVDPTNSTGAVYNANLLRALAAGYAGYGAINTFTSAGETNYNSMQLQVNRRFGKRLQWSSNYTWSKTQVYSRLTFDSDHLNKNVVNRPHVFNFNFGYRIPDLSGFWKNALTKNVLDGWNVNGTGAFYVGTPMTIGCTASNVPANLGNYWTGTPSTNVLPFRCQMVGNLWLADGATPASVGSAADPRLWYNFNPANFVLPPANSLGIGNTPPTLTYGPGFETFDISAYKDFTLGKESRVLELRAESFNLLNHFNPANPNTSLTYNFVTGAQTNANFGAITAATGNPRQMSLSVKLRF